MATLSDSTVEVSLTGNLARFVEDGTGEMKAKMTWKDFGIVFVYPWTVNIDQAVWSVTFTESNPSPPGAPGDGGAGNRIQNGNFQPRDLLVDPVESPKFTQDPVREQVLDNAFASRLVNETFDDITLSSYLRNFDEFQLFDSSVDADAVSEKTQEELVPVEYLTGLFD